MRICLILLGFLSFAASADTAYKRCVQDITDTNREAAIQKIQLCAESKNESNTQEDSKAEDKCDLRGLTNCKRVEIEITQFDIRTAYKDVDSMSELSKEEKVKWKKYYTDSYKNQVKSQFDYCALKFCRAKIQ